MAWRQRQHSRQNGSTPAPEFDPQAPSSSSFHVYLSRALFQSVSQCQRCHLSLALARSAPRVRPEKVKLKNGLEGFCCQHAPHVVAILVDLLAHT